VIELHRALWRQEVKRVKRVTKLKKGKETLNVERRMKEAKREEPEA